MGIKFLSGFRGYDNAKQHLRRSVHAGSDLTSGNTVLNPAQAFDQQACFVYLTESCKKKVREPTETILFLELQL